ncbi:MAG TPA: agmatinase [Chloroflexota bacterium]|nr:agmatinase [Chloroflexota bacterium]
MPRYQPMDASVSPRFVGIRTFMRLPHVTEMHDVDVAIVGIPFDTGATYRVGARFGPAAVREASALLRPYNPTQGVSIFERLSVVDAGDVVVTPGFIDDSYERITAHLEPILRAGVTTLAIGGDHSITLAELRAVAAVHGPVGLVQYDSHADTWDQYWGHQYTHGTPIRRAVEEGLIAPERSIQVGLRGGLYAEDDYALSTDLGLQIVPALEARERGLPAVAEMVKARLGTGPSFVTFDIDFLDPAYAPGTGTPEIGGFTTYEGQFLLRALHGANLVAADVVEVLPSFDHGSVTALAGAGMLYELLSLPARREK